MVPEFPGRNFFEGDISCAAKLAQGIERHRVERLNAAIQQRRYFSEFADQELAIFFGCKDGNNLGAKKRHEKPREPSNQNLHAVLRFWTKPNRCWPNWIINPNATRAHEK